MKAPRATQLNDSDYDNRVTALTGDRYSSNDNGRVSDMMEIEIEWRLL